MSNKAKYFELAAKVEATFPGGYWVDGCVDAENCTVKYDDQSEEFWAQMLASLHASVGMRLSEAGLDWRLAGIDY